MRSGQVHFVSRGAGLLVMGLLSACRTPSAPPPATDVPAKTAASVAAPPEPDPSGCVVAIVANEQHHEDAQGLISDIKFRERMIRCREHVWTERVRPSWATAERRPDDHHHLPNPERMARWLTRENDQLRLQLVDAAERQVIRVPADELRSVGFNADVETAFTLISKASLATMKPMAERTAAPRARWLESVSERGYNRVHWSDALDLPLEVEVGSHDGRDHNRMVLTFEKVPPATELPWNQIDNFERREYDEFLD